MSISFRALLALGLSFSALLASAQQSDKTTEDAKNDNQASDVQKAINLPPLNVQATDWRQYIRAKLKHQMAEVDHTQITVTKKATVTHLDMQPTVIDNNIAQLLVRSPGIQVSQQPTPTQFNMSYRGLGNPQESEYVLVLRDGVPLASDWIGFPTLYAMPFPQSIADVQLIRAGSSLLYGPEPAPVVNLVSRRPQQGAPLYASTEQVVGGRGLYSTYNAIEGSSGRWTFRADAAYVCSDGTRANAGSQLRQGDFYVDFRPDAQRKWWLDLHASNAASGDPGRLGYPQWQADPRATPTPWNRDWVDRYQLLLGHERSFGEWLLTGKLWVAYQDLASRSADAALAPQLLPTSSTLQDEQFRTRGIDVRARRKWGYGNAFTIGTVLFHGDDPFRQWSSPDLYADRHDRSGTPRLRQSRNTGYLSVFAENVFRLPYKIHIVPSIRLERERVAVDESVRPPFLSRPLINESNTRFVPLLGLGIGNDFGHGNETYFNVSQGWRPMRFFDMASPFSNVLPGNAPDPSRSLSWEAGVHGVPVTGLYYDASLFWIYFKSRIEAQHINATDVIEVNTGDTRHRGFEGQVNYDFLAPTERAENGEHLEAFFSVSLLNASFTDSMDPAQIGKIPAYAPRYLAKAGLTWRVEKRFKLSFTAVSSAAQFWQDSNQSGGTGDSYLPARIPAYTVFDVAVDWQLSDRVRLLGGVSNLGDRQYYNRVWRTGLEPAAGRSWYSGVSLSL